MKENSRKIKVTQGRFFDSKSNNRVMTNFVQTLDFIGFEMCF